MGKTLEKSGNFVSGNPAQRAILSLQLQKLCLFQNTVVNTAFINNFSNF